MPWDENAGLRIRRLGDLEWGEIRLQCDSEPRVAGCYMAIERLICERGIEILPEPDPDVPALGSR